MRQHVSATNRTIRRVMDKHASCVRIISVGAKIATLAMIVGYAMTSVTGSRKTVAASVKKVFSNREIWELPCASIVS
jgi:hypothetical protein